MPTTVDTADSPTSQSRRWICALCSLAVSSERQGKWRCCNPGTMFPGKFFVGPRPVRAIDLGARAELGARNRTDPCLALWAAGPHGSRHTHG